MRFVGPLSGGPENRTTPKLQGPSFEESSDLPEADPPFNSRPIVRSAGLQADKSEDKDIARAPQVEQRSDIRGPPLEDALRT